MKTTKLLLAVLTLNFGLGTFNSFAQTNGVGAGNCLQFDGVDDWVGITNAVLNQKANWTWEGWIFPENSGMIYSEGIPDVTFQLRVLSDGKISVSIWNVSYAGNWLGGSSDTDAVIFNQWNHIAVSLENGSVGSGTLKFYVNGRYISTANGQMELNYGTKYTAFGDNVGAHYGRTQGNSFFKGKIDEVRIWDKVLTQNEIRQNRCTQQTGSETGLLGYWAFDGDSTTVAIDLIPIPHNGTLANMDSVVSWIATDAGVVNTLAITGDATFCAGKSSLLDAGIGFTDYLWQDSSTAQTLLATTAGSYWVTALDSGCTTTDTITITQHALPAVDLGNDITLCTGMDTVLDAGSGYTSYAWATGGNTNTITVSSANTYSIIVTDSNGCSNSDTIIVTTKICTAINDQQQVSSTQLQVFPNPSDGNFELEIRNYELRLNNAVIKIYDVLGREIYKSEITNQSFKIQNLKSKIDKGVYFLQLATDEGVWNEKIIINN